VLRQALASIFGPCCRGDVMGRRYGRRALPSPPRGEGAGRRMRGPLVRTSSCPPNSWRKPNGVASLSQAPVQNRKDRFQHSRPLEKDLMVPKANNAVPLRIQPAGADDVVEALGMLGAIQFHHQPFFAAEKVHDVSAKRNLAGKFEAIQPARPQVAPEIIFRLSFRLPQLSCVGRLSGVAFGDVMSVRAWRPLIRLPAPSPRWGEGVSMASALPNPVSGCRTFCGDCRQRNTHPPFSPAGRRCPKGG
jgi:hypothetical protein